MASIGIVSPGRSAADVELGETQRHRLFVLCAIVTLSAFDRLLIAPLLPSIARGLIVSIGSVALVATVHFISYGLAQVGHGWLSDRIGRARAVRVALLGVAVGNVVAAAAPSLGVLIAARAVVGAASGGLVPGTLVLLADENAGAARARKQAVLIAALGGGTALTALVGLAGEGNGWRVMFALTAAASLLLIPLLGPNRPRPPQAAGPDARWTLRRPEVRFISLVAVPEGAAVFGFVVFFAVALQQLGSSLAVAALSTGILGLGMLAGGFGVRRLTNRVADRHLIVAGAMTLSLGYLLAAELTPAAMLAAAALAGLGQSALHSTLQRWATEAAPEARGLSTALFATGAFGGAGLAALAAALLAEHFAVLFIAGAISAGLAGIIASRHRAVASRGAKPLHGDGAPHRLDDPEGEAADEKAVRARACARAREERDERAMPVLERVGDDHR